MELSVNELLQSPSGTTSNPPEKTVYNDFADKYDSFAALPMAVLEGEMVTYALGDCTGAKVLDLGGGSGLHARRALAAGAALVDVVDISPAMMQIGRRISEQQGHGSRIRWHEGDCTLPLRTAELELQGELGYDIVMANWLFDHATNEAELEGMMANVAAYTRPGGKMINVRVVNPIVEGVREGKYGTTCRDVERIQGGIKNLVVIHASPEFSFEGTSMDATMDMSFEIERRYGFSDIKPVPASELDVVKNDMSGYWDPLVESPYFATVVATKV